MREALRTLGTELAWCFRSLPTWLGGQLRSACSSIAFCPNCRRNLNGDNYSFIEDAVVVRYTCATCDTKSAWDFDAPVPLYLGGWD